MRNNVSFRLAAVALVCVALLAIGLTLGYMLRTMPTAAPAATPTSAPFVLPTVVDPYIPKETGMVQRTLSCPDCQAAGQRANVWSDSAMTSVACRLDWNLPVAVVEQYGAMSLITGNGCRGWLKTSLLR